MKIGKLMNKIICFWYLSFESGTNESGPIHEITLHDHLIRFIQKDNFYERK